jgi:thiamine biosynthesis lipoprotein
LGLALVANGVGCRRDAVLVPDAVPSSSVPIPAATVASPRTKVNAEASAMGTRLTFVAVTSARCDEARTKAAIDQAISEIKRLEKLMTTWQTDSEVSRINQEAGRSAVRVGPETLGVIDKSLWISGVSEGVFDITFEVMHGLWRFDEDVDPHLPSRADVAEKKKLIGYRHVVVDKEKSTVFLDDPKTKISLGGIAKGYAIDRAAEILLGAGVKDFLAQAGGDLYVHGRRADGSPWVAGVRDPRGPEGSYFARMPVLDHAFSTAGDYERSYLIEGKRYHHIIDPRTGYPATASRSVTIWAKDALTADALDDAVFILGPTKGLLLVESTDDAGAIIVDRDNQVFVSKRLTGKVTIERPPTDGI